MSATIGDHETPLINLNPNMRPSSTMINIQEKNPTTGGYGPIKPNGIYETGSHKTVHELLTSMKDMQPKGTMIHAEVHYHRDDIKAQQEELAGQIAKSPNFSESAMPGGLGRQLAINAEAARRVPTKAGTSFKA